MSKHPYPLITVRWADHFFCEDNMTLAEIIARNKVPTIGEYTGYLITESKRSIALASNVWEDDPKTDIFPTMYIMKAAITYRSDKG